MERGIRLNWRYLSWAVIALILLAPLVAMQFTDEVRWTSFDFAVAAALLVGAAGSYELAAHFIQDRRRRVLLASGLLLLVALLWAQGAVGIF
ncbi:hypothetical protein [Sphingobium sp. EP60837]|uniref:Potassium transporter TrkH n=1 Tax=Sphingobium tyrosinilyticum TaxID=2715436 RepID=A0ABV9F252_9SPHN|nr:hypothetical protein [Sphingobium sp. EP60837]ANI78026.1 hypothetical protein EP837_01612 [Sphingobium sp. EP60837]